MTNEEAMTLCYERMEDTCLVEICVTGYGDTEKEAAGKARVKLECVKRQAYDD